jgi:hypothetical protein
MTQKRKAYNNEISMPKEGTEENKSRYENHIKIICKVHVK